MAAPLQLTEAMGGTVITPVPIFVDNQGTISLANNPVGPNRNLHIHARYFYVRDLVDGKEYIVYYVNTKDQLADMLCIKAQHHLFGFGIWRHGALS